jgi:TPR repeat protein
VVINAAVENRPPPLKIECVCPGNTTTSDPGRRRKRIVACDRRQRTNVGYGCLKCCAEKRNERKLINLCAESDAALAERLRAAAEQGDAGAQFQLALCYRKGAGVAQDDRAAVEWYRKAAAQDHADAQYNLGYCCRYGVGVPVNERAAVEWFRNAAAQVHSRAQVALGCCYATGAGVAKDDRAAVECWRAAGMQGNADGQYNLGVCLWHGGRGVARDRRAAIEWWRKAAKQRDEKAIAALRKYDRSEQPRREEEKCVVQ